MPATLRIAAGAAIVLESDRRLRPGYRPRRSPGTMPSAREGLTMRLVNTLHSGTARLRLAMAVLAVASAALVAGQKHLLARPGLGLPLVLACALPFAADACWPRLGRPGWALAAAMAVAAVSATALLAYRPAEGDAAVLFFIALGACVAAAAGPRVSVPVGVLIVALPEVVGHLGGSRTPVVAAIGIAFAWVAGTAVRAQARTAADLVAMQAAAARHQIAAERQQLAREFHDLVGHTLSVTMLHMTAVRMSLEDGETGEALESLDQAQRAGREAMREMRQTVTLLGSPQGDDPPAALPHVRDLPELVAGYAAAGLKVNLDAGGGLTEVPGDVGLAAYRIAQESLTNAARHAPGSAACVQVRATSTELRLMITNDTGRRAPQPVVMPGTGHGIAGMTQRARLAGGALTAGPSNGQWRVEAVLPVGDRR
jgi:signal transduction histidine kinase